MSSKEDVNVNNAGAVKPEPTNAKAAIAIGHIRAHFYKETMT